MPPIQLWTYRFWHPTYKNHVTLDCPAFTVQGALRSARRWLRMQNYRFHRAKVTRHIPVPTSEWQMSLEKAR